ncbi:MAG TPA: hypothetical protein VM165_09965 [Planctomycetaceae bacterium]|nr:hypothetical protein [Planctomycetaceae bacterium]
MFWCFRCVRNLIGAIVALAGLLALTEVGLRITRITHPDLIAAPEETCPLAMPSAVTGWELQPAGRTRVNTERGEAVVFRTNSLGLRGEEVATPKPQGVYRIICLGDEALLAATLPDEFTLPQQIAKRLQSTTQSRIEVLNAGLPHGSPETAVIHYRHRLAVLQPDLVILHVHAGDVADDQSHRKWMIRDPQGHALVCAHPDLRSSPKELPVAELRREFAVIDWAWTQAGQQWTDPQPTPRSRPQRMTQSAVEQMLTPIEHLAALCQATSAAFVVCLAPTNEPEITAKLDSDGPFAAAAFAWLAERRIAVVDGMAAFRSRDDFLTTSEGWSPTGQSHLGDFLATQIVQNLRGPWSAPYAAPTTLPVNHTQPASADSARQPRTVR